MYIYIYLHMYVYIYMYIYSGINRKIYMYLGTRNIERDSCVHCLYYPVRVRFCTISQALNLF